MENEIKVEMEGRNANWTLHAGNTALSIWVVGELDKTKVEVATGLADDLNGLRTIKSEREDVP